MRKQGMFRLSSTVLMVAALGGMTLTADAASKSSKTVTMTVMNSGTYNVEATALEKPFQRRTGINVKIYAFPYATLEQQNTQDLISGTGKYQVISGSYYLAPVYSYFTNLNSFIHKWANRNKLVPGLLAHSEYYNGNHIGIPYGPDAYGMIYNKTYFKEAGIRSFPTTWPEFFRDLRILKTKLASKGIAPFVFAGGDPSQAPALFFASYTGSFFNSQHNYSLNVAKATIAMQRAKQMLQYGPSDITGLSIDQANTVFLQGKAAILYGWPSFIDKAAYEPSQSKVVGHWGVAADPQPGLTWLSLWQLYMSKKTPDKSAAWKWIQDFTSPKNDITNFVKFGVDPMYQSTYNNKHMKKKYGNYFKGEEINLSHAKNPPLTAQAQNYLSSVLGELYSGSVTPAKAVSQVNSNWNTMTAPSVLRQEWAKWNAK